MAILHKLFRRNLLAFAAVGVVAGAGFANAATIVVDPTNVDSIPGLTGYATTGGDMSGLSIALTFADGSSETASWVATGTIPGHATGTGWNIELAGDSYTAHWGVDFGTLDVVKMVLDGGPGLTVFDRTDGSGFKDKGTPGSEEGLDFASSLADDSSITATYSNEVAIGANSPVGDLWHVLTVDFSDLNSGDGATGRFSFVQDTDNDSRYAAVPEVPEPATFGFFALALAGFGFMRRRRV